MLMSSPHQGQYWGHWKLTWLRDLGLKLKLEPAGRTLVSRSELGQRLCDRESQLDSESASWVALVVFGTGVGISRPPVIPGTLEILKSRQNGEVPGLDADKNAAKMVIHPYAAD
jgi:hypothetical protein